MRTLRQLSQFKLLLLFWACAAVCLVGAVVWSVSVRSTESWPKERARVVRSEVVSSQVGNYRGQVEVELASGRREVIELPFASSSRSRIEGALERTPPGLELLVFISPADGAQVRLPLSSDDYVAPGILAGRGIMLGVIPLLTVMVAERSRTSVVVSGAMYGIAAVFLVVALLVGWQRTEMLSWTEAEAHVLEHGAVSRATRKRTPRYWAPVLKVRYEAAGETVENHLQSEREFPSERSALEYLEQDYPTDRPTTVHYNPKWPKAATFEAAASLRFFAIPSMFALFALLTALLGAVAGRRTGER